MRRMERKAMLAQQAKPTVANTQSEPEHGWVISWDYAGHANQSVRIVGRCVAIGVWHELNDLKGVTNLKCTPYLDMWECMSDDPDVYWQKDEW